MNELNTLVEHAEQLLKGIHSSSSSAPFDFEPSFNAIIHCWLLMQDREVASRLGDSVNRLVDVRYALQKHPHDRGLRDCVVIPGINKFVYAVESEIFHIKFRSPVGAV